MYGRREYARIPPLIGPRPGNMLASLLRLAGVRASGAVAQGVRARAGQLLLGAVRVGGGGGRRGQ
eukprot:5121072-Pyramimonas_sp.AAC.1